MKIKLKNGKKWNPLVLVRNMLILASFVWFIKAFMDAVIYEISL